MFDLSVWRRRVAAPVLLALGAMGVVLAMPQQASAAVDCGAIAGVSVVYVDVDATGLDNGATWADAFTDLQDALEAARTCGGFGSIWIAEGEYTPGREPLVDVGGTGPSRFRMVANVSLFGGFGGGESSANQADPILRPTILSGDNNGDSGPNNDLDFDNSYVMIEADASATDVRIDGLQIRDAHYRGNLHGFSQPVVVVEGGELTISRTVISDNATDLGVARIIDGGQLTVLNSEVSNNTSTRVAAGFLNSESTLTIANSLISDNSTDGFAGAIYNYGGTTYIGASTVVNNSVDPVEGIGGGIYSTFAGGVTTVEGSIFHGNTPAEVRLVEGTIDWSSSIIEGSGGSAAWIASNGTDLGSNTDVNPLFVQPAGPNYRLQSNSLALDNSAAPGLPVDEFDLDEDGSSTDALPDLDQSSRIKGAGMDRGAYERGTIPPTIPNTPTLVSPTGDTYESPLQFVWRNDTAATEFTIYVNEAGFDGVNIVSKTLSSAAVCTVAGNPVGDCTYTATESFPVHGYIWAVMASSPAGDGPQSDFFSFEVVDPPGPPLAVTTFIAPVSATEDMTPEFRWVQPDDTTAYQLWVQSLTGGGIVHNEIHPVDAGEVVCDGSECAITPDGLELPYDSYRWWVRTSNDLGNGPWSDAANFEVQPPRPGQITADSPFRDGISATPVFFFSKDDNATEYRFYIQSQEGGGLIQDEIYTVGADAVLCGSVDCRLQADVHGLTLPDSAYRWWVQARNSAGPGPWSEAQDFRVGFFTPPAEPPSKVTLIAPTGDGHSSAAEFQWSEDDNADGYRLWVQSDDGAGVISDAIYTEFGLPNVRCSNDVCKATLGWFGIVLADGDYRFWVQAQSEVGNAPWSDVMTFTVGTPDPLPVTPTVVAPSLTIDEQSPTIEFSHGDFTDAYRIWISSLNGAGKVFDSVLQSGDMDCTTNCRVTPAGLSFDAGSYRIWVQGQNETGNGSWSQPLDFTVVTEAPTAAMTVIAPAEGETSVPQLATITWTEDPLATLYTIIGSSNGGDLIPVGTANGNHDLDEVSCSGGECSVTLTSPLPVGTFELFVRARNAHGIGPYNAPARTFEVE